MSQSTSIVNLDLSFLFSSVGACTLALPFMGKFAVSATTPFGLILSVKLAQFLGVTLSRRKAAKEAQLDKELETTDNDSSHERLHPAKEKLQAQKSAADKMIITLLLLLYPSISNQAFTMFRCRTVGGLMNDLGLEQKQILEADYSVECYVGGHRQYLFVAGAAIVIYAIGVPVILFYMLWSNRSHLHDETHAKFHLEVRSRLGNFFLQCK
jgi:hypothetical protein